MMALHLAGLEHRAADGQPMLAAIERTLVPGRLVCISGPSGAGKTTLMSILAAVVVPSHGRLLHGDRAISALPEPERRAWRRAKVGLVFQTCRLVDVLSADDHLVLACRLRNRPEAIAKGRDWLEKLGLADKRNSRPGALSGGEKQRLALAQTLAFDLPILLADEPTAALDAGNAAAVAGHLAAYARSAAAIVVAVSHDRELIDAADDLIVLSKPGETPQHREQMT